MNIFKFLVYSIGLFFAIVFAFKHHYQTPDLLFPAKISTTIPKKSIRTSEVNPNVAIGKKLFKNNCASCHNKNMRDDLTGPALANVLERWEGRENLLYEWIRNPAKVLESGDPYALRLYKDWNQVQMTSFPNLENMEIKALLDYIESVNS